MKSGFCRLSSRTHFSAPFVLSSKAIFSINLRFSSTFEELPSIQRSISSKGFLLTLRITLHTTASSTTMDLLSLPPETFEQILLLLPPKSLLHLQGVNKSVQQFIFSNLKLRASLWLDPLPAQSTSMTHLLKSRGPTEAYKDAASPDPARG